MSTDVRYIRPGTSIDLSIKVPPSKSYTARALIAGALADGSTTLVNPSNSEDTEFLIGALRRFGVRIEQSGNSLEIEGTHGCLKNPGGEIFVGNAGTALRFLTTLACLAPGESVITGDEQLKQRPVSDLVDALHMAGIKCSSVNGHPPVTVRGGSFAGGRVDVKGEISSQFVSSLLLSAPYAKRPLAIFIKGRLSSQPYVDMSLHVMRSFGADIDIVDPNVYHVNNNQKYIGHEFVVEADASSATYFLAAAAILGGRCIINDISPESLQGDVRFMHILEQMGCAILKHENAIEVRGGKLFGIDVDMNEMPDCVPTLAVVAAFAEGPTSITNIAHLRHKETDRLAALTTELRRLGAAVEQFPDALIIHPSEMRGTVVETYNDHRIAMSLALVGLRIEGVGITNPKCVAKSYPAFWKEFERIEGRSK